MTTTKKQNKLVLLTIAKNIIGPTTKTLTIVTDEASFEHDRQVTCSWRDSCKEYRSCISSTSTTREITCHVGTSVICHQAEVIFPPSPQPMQVLNLAIPRGIHGGVDLVVVISRDSLPAKDCHLSQR